jgi:hypothetical protein
MVDDDDDRRVKDLIAAAKAGDAEIDPATAADLARWFGMPSYQQVAEGEVKLERRPEDPQVVARREAIDKALESIDPVLCDELHARWADVDTLILFEPAELRRIDPSISALDPVLVALADMADPREVEIPIEMFDDLRECTPQAVLRDLARPEIEFRLALEVDQSVAAALPVDGVALVREAVRTRNKPELGGPSVSTQIREALAPVKRAKREPWAELRTPGRRVSE